ncbi:MAG: hypothetical protein ACMUIU_01915 [bacterium]
MNLKIRMTSFKHILIIIGIMIFMLGSVSVNEIYGYYSLPEIFAFSRIGFPLMSYGLSGIPLYNYFSTPYFIGGNHNLTFGLSNVSLQGLLNQPYCMGSFYGPNGVPGLYGLSSLYGLNTLNSLSLGLHNSGFAGNLITMNLNSQLFAAEQAGTWTGTWNLGFLFGTMIMNLQEAITGSLSGTAQLIGNLTFGGIFNVYGSSDPTFLYLTGQDPTLTYAVTIQGILTTPGTMEGFYSIYKIGATVPKETGTFSLELLI